MSDSSYRRKTIDLPLVFVFLALLMIGYLVRYATEYQTGTFIDAALNDPLIFREGVWLVCSLICFLIFYNINWKIWSNLSPVIYGITSTLLIGVLIFGLDIKGARSWYNFAGVSFQPSELGKFGAAILISEYLSRKSININNPLHLGLSIVIIGFPALLILMQPDAGSALTFLSFFLLFFRAGLSPSFYAISFSIIAACLSSQIFGLTQTVFTILFISTFVLTMMSHLWRIVMPVYLILSAIYFTFLSQGLNLVSLGILVLPWMLSLGYHIFYKNFRIVISAVIAFVFLSFFAWFTNFSVQNILKPHQQDRVNVWLRPDLCDPQGSLYNILQSKTAIGSGGVYGKGFLKGVMTKLDFVPEQNTDFIFCAIGEEQGFLGVFGLIILFSFLIIRVVNIAERGRFDFIKYYGYSFAGFLLFHMIVNIGMTMGLVPVIGIPLPFISKGGSSMIIFSMMIAILAKLDTYRYT